MAQEARRTPEAWKAPEAGRSGAPEGTEATFAPVSKRTCALLSPFLAFISNFPIFLQLVSLSQPQSTRNYRKSVFCLV